MQNIFTHYKERGFLTAIDDFGAGYAGLGLLAEFQPQLIKLDMNLIRDIDKSASKKSIVGGVIHTCRDMNIDIIGEGIESAEELDFLRSKGISKFQGYYFARPAIEQLPAVSFTH